ncbi:Transcription factor, K-box [Dillenia turbinata]|uniref:Transcription factor, K-box n=1 Tax=Dillenia turbinata TaxID=194707 RepID=A0AAN8VQN5_9MAGN
MRAPVLKSTVAVASSRTRILVLRNSAQARLTYFSRLFCSVLLSYLVLPLEVLLCILCGQMQRNDCKEADTLKDEIVKLQLRQLQLMGKELDGLSLKELQHLEQQLSEGLVCVKERKEHMLMEQLEQSRIKEQHAMMENETLRRQVIMVIQELRRLLPPAESMVPAYIEYYSADRKTPVTKIGTMSSGACNGATEKGISDTTLHLGPPSDAYCESKAPETEITGSNNSWTRTSPI